MKYCIVDNQVCSIKGSTIKILKPQPKFGIFKWSGGNGTYHISNAVKVFTNDKAAQKFADKYPDKEYVVRTLKYVHNNPRKRMKRKPVRRNPEKAITTRKYPSKKKLYQRTSRTVRRIGREILRKNSPYSYTVQIERNGKWVALGAFSIKDNAVTYGKSVAAKFKSKRVRVVWK